MPRSICKNCKHCHKHPDGNLCDKKLIFVQENGYCEGFEDNELFDLKNIVLFTVAVVGIVYLLLKIL